MTERESGLERSVGFVMGVTYRKLSMLLQQRLKPFDITPEQWSVLVHVARSDGLIQKEIAELAGKDKPTTTRILDHLEGKGLIVKQTGEADRRSFLVHITDKGKALIERTAPIERGLLQDVKQCMTDEEYDRLLDLLRRIERHANLLKDRE
ncbi:MarR family winged helix-turn-helix transcriptional regulator [Paenibacillus flagellatus]|uniref:MarR family transcriptional regulator n=1 Tax=Paenibacillus flagellatus TaxID=2211139 RepID=A0A2V5KDS1_9BACL|nr:MarR family transcriptional regulator [Paenibacillus flagellatus]PYI56133.1 MarR family transcriptional regulator [Paenibacillus flagellatus]